MKTALKKVRGLGAAHNGVHHWWLQRVTAIALIPLVIWFTAKVVCTVSCNVSIDYILKNEFSLVLFALTLFTMLYHSTLGIKVIIEDYVHCKCAKPGLIIAINLIAWLTGIFLLFVIIKNFVALV